MKLGVLVAAKTRHCVCVCVCVLLQVPVGPPSEVEEIFDTISYAKGSCVIRMLHEWIGEEVRGGVEGVRGRV